LGILGKLEEMEKKNEQLSRENEMLRETNKLLLAREYNEALRDNMDPIC